MKVKKIFAVILTTASLFTVAGCSLIQKDNTSIVEDNNIEYSKSYKNKYSTIINTLNEDTNFTDNYLKLEWNEKTDSPKVSDKISISKTNNSMTIAIKNTVGDKENQLIKMMSEGLTDDNYEEYEKIYAELQSEESNEELTDNTTCQLIINSYCFFKESENISDTNLLSEYDSYSDQFSYLALLVSTYNQIVFKGEEITDESKAFFSDIEMYDSTYENVIGHISYDAECTFTDDGNIADYTSIFTFTK